ncbi:hypothetical protein ACLOJK_013295 [Asimina triloba]
MAASLHGLSFRRPLSLCLILLLLTSLSLCIFSEAQLQKQEFLLTRRRTPVEREEQPKQKTSLEKSSSSTSGSKNQTKTLKPAKLTTNSTTKAKPTIAENKNQTKLIKPTKTATNSTSKTTLFKTELKNQTTSILTKKSLDLLKDSKSNSPKNNSTSIIKDPKPNPAKNKTASPTKQSSLSEAKLNRAASSKISPPLSEKKSTAQKKIKTDTKSKKPTLQNIFQDDTDNEDLINEFRYLPSKFHDAIMPDLEKISTTSKAYISKANEEIAQGFKPLVGKKYASVVGSLTSCIFLLVPLLLVSLLFNRIRIYFPLQKILIFIQVYLAIYFAILSLAHFATGIEPLRFFYTTSRSSYITIQAFQTLGYVLYLLLQLLNLVVLFANVEDGVGMKFLGLAQTMVGFAVGLHYYAAVFHRAVVGQPPKTSWKIHAIYAVCFLVICLFARAERRKKVYLQEGSNDDGKKS